MRKTAKIVSGGSRTTIVGGTTTIITKGNHYMYSEGDIVFNAEGKITLTAGKEHVYGDYVPPEEIYTTHPTVLKVEFFDENNKLLNQHTKDFYYGIKLKIRVTTRNAKDGTVIFVKLKGKSKSRNQPFDLMSPNSNYNWWAQAVVNNEFETPLFQLNPNWYSDDFEYYDYNDHITKIKEEDLNEFFAEVMFDSKTVYWPLAGERLKPIAYKRNYEELIGLFNTDNSGIKDLLENYENKFIDSVKDVKWIVDDFSAFIHEDNCDLTIDQIEAEVANCAKKLWDEAVWQNQGYDLSVKTKDSETGEEKITITKVSAILDDRPLYWARIAMQVILKRHPAYYDDIKTLDQKDQDDFFIKSIVPKTSKLWKTILLFEEQSRNYTNIDFSKAGYKKKVLITGFDPFVLNEFKFKGAKINTQNPSGISALHFHGKTIGNAYIQCGIVPVRYEDFDNGIIENLVKNNIIQFDIMMTMSRNNTNFDIERFACKFRGAFYDNMCIGDSQLYLGNNDWDRSRFKQILFGNEFYETTLPIDKILTGDIEASKNIVFFDQSVIDDKGFKIFHPIKSKILNTSIKSFSITSITGKSTFDSGSGGDYLSNEIMYRATKERDSLGLHDSKAIGHFHISSVSDSNEYLNIISKIINNATN